jgi:hypothetical protein
MSLLKEEDDKELMKLDIYEDYELMEMEKRKMEVILKEDEEKTGKLL